MQQGSFCTIQHSSCRLSAPALCCRLQLSLCCWASLWLLSSSSTAHMPAKQTPISGDLGIAGYPRGTRAADSVCGRRPCSTQEARKNRHNLSVPKQSCCCSPFDLLLQQLVQPLTQLQQCSNTKPPRSLTQPTLSAPKRSCCCRASDFSLSCWFSQWLSAASWFRSWRRRLASCCLLAASISAAAFLPSSSPFWRVSSRLRSCSRHTPF